MPTTEERLTPEQRELVAIGASVGAGCLPCSSFHFKQSRAIGLEAGRMLGDSFQLQGEVVHGDKLSATPMSFFPCTCTKSSTPKRTSPPRCPGSIGSWQR